MSTSNQKQDYRSRFDQYFWPVYPEVNINVPFTRKISALGLLRFRLFGCLIGWTGAISGLYYREYLYFTFLTLWGVSVTTFAFCQIAYLQHRARKTLTLIQGGRADNDVIEKRLNRERVLFRRTNIWYEIAFNFEIVIFIVFWCVLAPLAPQLLNSPSRILYNICVHFGMFACLATEFILGRFIYHKRHAWFIVSFGGIYMILNAILGLAGHPVYGAIDTWQNVASIFFVGGSMILLAGGFVFLLWASKKKIASMESSPILIAEQKNNDYIKVTQKEI